MNTLRVNRQPSPAALAFSAFGGNSRTEKLQANAGFKTSALPVEAPERPQAILGPPLCVQSKPTLAVRY